MAGSKAWTLLSLGAAVGSATVAKKALNGGWKAATGKNPPSNPADPDVDLWEAVAWATVSGTTIAVLKMLAARKAANYYAKSTGHLPPGLEADGDTSQDPASDAGHVVGAAS
ncbi:DUF4235 domain-containing protein [Nocardioides sp. AE5]|uniref:DUF4235 domain-containing protein n=1 Tax=Nocardioides sp. AE5 TaxID=2962573 RepID=UPI002882C9BA|nr:DUF4235 domain-containing protein [Nocardioides sp. AE5]MDT0201381.1 DUF4235 domain-containing protein [Nocardioides sp. AE5]